MVGNVGEPMKQAGTLEVTRVLWDGQHRSEGGWRVGNRGNNVPFAGLVGKN